MAPTSTPSSSVPSSVPSSVSSSPALSHSFKALSSLLNNTVNRQRKSILTNLLPSSNRSDTTESHSTVTLSGDSFSASKHYSRGEMLGNYNYNSYHGNNQGSNNSYSSSNNYHVYNEGTKAEPSLFPPDTPGKDDRHAPTSHIGEYYGSLSRSDLNLALQNRDAKERHRAAV